MIAAALALAAAGWAEDPRKFIDHVYAEYRHKDFTPLARPEDFFAPPLAAAIRRDSGTAGEVGYLDGDPLCDCQDYGRLTAKIRSLSQSTSRTASARVRVTLDRSETRDLRLTLVRALAGWRIADVIGTDRHSLLKELQRGKATRGPHRR